ncbi:hypothetical protein H0H92_009671 [Tricholoma furcatifolium]|nr:hypothetical protein H0H92_009671 [Tricholoma furcatifolium]
MFWSTTSLLDHNPLTYMGRRAKFLTVAEAQEAARQRRKEYALTTRQEARKAQNQRAYEKLKSRTAAISASTIPASLSPPPIPSQLHDMADISIPTSPIFQLAFGHENPFEDTEHDDRMLAAWDLPPPYAEPPPGRIRSFLDILMGYRLRQRKKEETARLERYKNRPLRDFATEVCAELTRSYADWEVLHRVAEGMQKGFERQLALRLLRWRAYRVLTLDQDFTSLLQGSDAFLNLYVERWTRIR